MTWEQLQSKALQPEANAVTFYTVAAEKIRALPEASLALARAGRRRAADKGRLGNSNHNEGDQFHFDGERGRLSGA